MADGDPKDQGSPLPTDQTPTEDPSNQIEPEQSLSDTEPDLDHFLGSEDRATPRVHLDQPRRRKQ
jgi:hypothetical protein